jgi:hypothetical protein
MLNIVLDADKSAVIDRMGEDGIELSGKDISMEQYDLFISYTYQYLELVS